MNRTELHPVEALILAVVMTAWAVLTIARTVMVPVVALLITLASGRPDAAATSSTPPRPTPPWVPPTLPGLEAHTAVELRRMARASGLPRALCRSGRKADLLLALAVAY